MNSSLFPRGRESKPAYWTSFSYSDWRRRVQLLSEFDPNYGPTGYRLSALGRQVLDRGPWATQLDPQSV